ncbi:hypothetical protein EY01_15550, partial [Staphylococcus aureus]
MCFSKVKQYGEISFVGHRQQEYSQRLYENVMSQITSRDVEDITRPSQVSCITPSPKVSSRQDHHTLISNTPSDGRTSAHI